MVPTTSVGARGEGVKGSKGSEGEQRGVKGAKGGEGGQRGVKGAKGANKPSACETNPGHLGDTLGTSRNYSREICLVYLTAAQGIGHSLGPASGQPWASGQPRALGLGPALGEGPYPLVPQRWWGP